MSLSKSAFRRYKVHKIITHYEIFIYMNGKLTYKKWFNSTQSLVFDIMPYDRHTLVSITDEGSTKNFENGSKTSEINQISNESTISPSEQEKIRDFIRFSNDIVKLVKGRNF